jgi:hypothetical protein
MIADNASGARPIRAMRRIVSRTGKPQSSMTRVSPHSTMSALPALPLPKELKRIKPPHRPHFRRIRYSACE